MTRFAGVAEIRRTLVDLGYSEPPASLRLTLRNGRQLVGLVTKVSEDDVVYLSTGALVVLGEVAAVELYPVEGAA